MKTIGINFITLLSLLLFNCREKDFEFNLIDIEKERVLIKAKKNLNLIPITVTDSFSERSAGTKHDYFSEGDYWWPNPEDLSGEYIRKDGQTNPNNFTAHRKAMLRLNDISASLASAYIVSNDSEYIKQLIPHLKAWFVDEHTKMNPNLLYAQAIKGKVTGRGIGIIDTVHLTEVALAVKVAEGSGLVSEEIIYLIKDWFRTYLNWMQIHPFGIDERDNGNNHSVCWALQVATFAYLVNDNEAFEFCKRFYKETLLPEQMNTKGAFPKELKRTKPYAYSLFNLDAMANLCQVLSSKEDNLFYYKTKTGKSLEKGIEFMYPFIENKKMWLYPKDVMYFNEWPVRQSALLFGGLHYNKDSYLRLWQSLDANFKTPEIVRNMPMKYPLLWNLTNK